MSNAEPPKKYKIEKGIPLPCRYPLRPSFPLTRMRPGDSFLISAADKSETDKMRTRVSYAIEYTKRKSKDKKEWVFSTRIVEGGLRVWRVK